MKKDIRKNLEIFYLYSVLIPHYQILANYASSESILASNQKQRLNPNYAKILSIFSLVP